MNSLSKVLYGWFQSARMPQDWNSFFCCSKASFANCRAVKIKREKISRFDRLFFIPNCRTINGFLLFVFVRCFSKAFNSIGKPWQSQPGRKSIRKPLSKLYRTIMSFWILTMKNECSIVIRPRQKRTLLRKCPMCKGPLANGGPSWRTKFGRSICFFCHSQSWLSGYF